MASGLTPTYLLPYPIITDPVDVSGDIEDLATAIEGQLLLKASVASPSFSGTPTAPTASSDTNTTQIATTQFVINQGYLKSSIASSTYAPINSPVLTGSPESTTPPLGDNSTRIATTEFVATELENFVTLPDQSGADGLFLTSDGTNASWVQLQTSDIFGLDTFIESLPTTYSPIHLDIDEYSTSPILSLADENKLFVMDNVLSSGVELPVDSSVNFPIGASISFLRKGSGLFTFSVESGGTLLATPGADLRAVGSFATAIKYAANSWLVAGDLI